MARANQEPILKAALLDCQKAGLISVILVEIAVDLTMHEHMPQVTKIQTSRVVVGRRLVRPNHGCTVGSDVELFKGPTDGHQKEPRAWTEVWIDPQFSSTSGYQWHKSLHWTLPGGFTTTDP